MIEEKNKKLTDYPDLKQICEELQRLHTELMLIVKKNIK